MAQCLIFSNPICPNRNQIGGVIYSSQTNQLTGHSCQSLYESGCPGPCPGSKHKIWLPRASRILGKTPSLQGQAGCDPHHHYSHHFPKHNPKSEAICLSVPMSCGPAGAWRPEGRAMHKGITRFPWRPSPHPHAQVEAVSCCNEFVTLLRLFPLGAGWRFAAV